MASPELTPVSPFPPENSMYCARKDRPFHLSVGAVVFREDEVAVLYSPPEFDNPWGFTDFDQLVRETPENDEPFHDAVHRGVEEELGVRGRIIRPLGTMVVDVWSKYWRQHYRKTTHYHLMECASVDDALRDRSEAEGGLAVQWFTADEAVERQRWQEPRMRGMGRPDLCEADIVEVAARSIRALVPPATVIDLGARMPGNSR